MPKPTFSEMQTDLERRSRDLTSDIELLRDWPLMEWNSVLDLIKHTALSLETMSEIAANFENETRRVIATGTLGQRGHVMEDNPYTVKLAPDEFHELLSEYENCWEWCEKSMTDKQRELAGRVLDKLRAADATHVCVDED